MFRIYAILVLFLVTGKVSANSDEACITSHLPRLRTSAKEAVSSMVSAKIENYFINAYKEIGYQINVDDIEYSLKVTNSEDSTKVFIEFSEVMVNAGELTRRFTILPSSRDSDGEDLYFYYGVYHPRLVRKTNPIGDDLGLLCESQLGISIKVNLQIQSLRTGAILSEGIDLSKFIQFEYSAD
ncbi:MAG: hypothetical protein H6625_08605 [Bdellovibrionaceae bacterium]|nr:hypothetical protein [Pseudobdellovibrionaceae bacterium]